MSRRSTIGLVLIAGIAMPWLTVMVRNHARTSATLAAAQTSLASTISSARELQGLRGREPVVEYSHRPTQDVIAHVNAVMAQAGIEINGHFRGLVPESDSQVSQSSDEAGPKVRQQSMRLTLDAMMLPELGRFMAVWLEAQPLWTPTRLELNHARGRSSARSTAKAPSAEGTSNYDVTLVLTALYVAE